MRWLLALRTWFRDLHAEDQGTNWPIDVIAVEAGGCAPPIIIPLQAREIDRAHVEAGIMTLAEYLRLYPAQAQAGGH